MTIAICKHCGKQFTKKYPQQIYCNSSCRIEYKKSKYVSRTKKKKYKKICKICKIPFKTKRVGQILCGSYKCRLEMNRLNISSYKAYLKIRFKIFMRDNFACQYCGRTIKDKIKLEIDHFIPVSKGGKDIEENLITSCNECNLGKGDFLLKERKERQVKINY